ncbi:MAG TPA: response regulator, partial [Longimicrobiales bacterium]|nr:response regulator [Longimicrobiales bacterium]
MSEARVRILSVEDDPAQAELIAKILGESTRPTFEVVSASSLADALAILQRRAFDLVLLELALPDSRPAETFARVQAAVPEVPIVILTDVEDTALAARAVEAGAQDYLTETEIHGPTIIRAI